MGGVVEIERTRMQIFPTKNLIYFKSKTQSVAEPEFQKSLGKKNLRTNLP